MCKVEYSGVRLPLSKKKCEATPNTFLVLRIFLPKMWSEQANFFLKKLLGYEYDMCSHLSVGEVCVYFFFQNIAS